MGSIYECHFAKTTFGSGASQVRTRVIASHGQCRTFTLCKKGQVPKNIQQAKDRKELVLAAMTVRINPYSKFAKMWAQVLHMSAWEERQGGHGSKLVAAVEELLRQEGVDVIVSYPAPTQQATASSPTAPRPPRIGFALATGGHLSISESAPHQAEGSDPGLGGHHER